MPWSVPPMASLVHPLGWPDPSWLREEGAGKQSSLCWFRKDLREQRGGRRVPGSKATRSRAFPSARLATCSDHTRSGDKQQRSLCSWAKDSPIIYTPGSAPWPCPPSTPAWRTPTSSLLPGGEAVCSSSHCSGVSASPVTSPE